MSPIDVLAVSAVALRKESVDRNLYGLPKELLKQVALRKESVDRNSVQPRKTEVPGASLSARRAWIEIIVYRLNCHLTESLSARRAWIEIGNKKAPARVSKGRSPQGERG